MAQLVKRIDVRTGGLGRSRKFVLHVTAFNQSDYSIDQSNRRTIVKCQNKLTTYHQCGNLLYSRQLSYQPELEVYEFQSHRGQFLLTERQSRPPNFGDNGIGPTLLTSLRSSIT